MSDPQERACAHCNNAKHAADDIYECRVWPPETVDGEGDEIRMVFPLVMADMWCGQFSRRVN